MRAPAAGCSTCGPFWWWRLTADARQAGGRARQQALPPRAARRRGQASGRGCLLWCFAEDGRQPGSQVAGQAGRGGGRIGKATGQTRQAQPSPPTPLCRPEYSQHVPPPPSLPATSPFYSRQTGSRFPALSSACAGPLAPRQGLRVQRRGRRAGGISLHEAAASSEGRAPGAMHMLPPEPQ